MKEWHCVSLHQIDKAGFSVCVCTSCINEREGNLWFITPWGRYTAEVPKQWRIMGANVSDPVFELERAISCLISRIKRNSILTTKVLFLIMIYGHRFSSQKEGGNPDAMNTEQDDGNMLEMPTSFSAEEFHWRECLSRIEPKLLSMSTILELNWKGIVFKAMIGWRKEKKRCTFTYCLQSFTTIWAKTNLSIYAAFWNTEWEKSKSSLSLPKMLHFSLWRNNSTLHWCQNNMLKVFLSTTPWSQTRPGFKLPENANITYSYNL